MNNRKSCKRLVVDYQSPLRTSRTAPKSSPPSCLCPRYIRRRTMRWRTSRWHRRLTQSGSKRGAATTNQRCTLTSRSRIDSKVSAICCFTFFYSWEVKVNVQNHRCDRSENLQIARSWFMIPPPYLAGLPKVVLARNITFDKIKDDDLAEVYIHNVH